MFTAGNVELLPAKFEEFQSIIFPSKNLSINEGNDGAQLFVNLASVIVFPSIILVKH
jgi:hypothetical protein